MSLLPFANAPSAPVPPDTTHVLKAGDTMTGPLTVGGLVTSTGSLAINQIFYPTGIAVAHTGASGTSSNTYLVSASINGLYTDFGQASVSNSVPYSSLNTTTFNTITWNAVPGAQGYVVNDPTNRQIATTTTGLSAIDTGQTNLPTIGLPSNNQTGGIVTYNSSVLPGGYFTAKDTVNNHYTTLTHGAINYINPSNGTLYLANIGSNELGVSYQLIEIYHTLKVYGLLYPSQASTAPTYVKGAIYFDTTLNKLRVGGATGWETITSA